MSINWNKNQENVSPSFRLFAVLSPYFAREMLSFLVYSICRFESFFESGPNEFYFFVPLNIFKVLISRPSKNLHIYQAITIHINSLFDLEPIDIYSTEIQGIDRIKIDNRFYPIITKNNFTYTNERVFKSNEHFIFIKLKPKQHINHLDTDFLVDYM